MFPPLLPYEGDILLWINQHHNAFLDAFMYMISNTGAWLPVIAVLIYYIFAKKPWQEALLLLLTIGLCVALGDQLSSGFAKPFFHRFRPTHAPEYKELIHTVYNYVGYPYGFFSGHACNFFGAATVLSLAIRRWEHTLSLFGIATLVAYSRMYLGVHFLSDILVGMGVGIALGFLCNALREFIRHRYIHLGRKESRRVFTPNYKLWLGTLLVFLPVLAAYAWQFTRIFKLL